jgi:hypothetical protein
MKKIKTLAISALLLGVYAGMASAQSVSFIVTGDKTGVPLTFSPEGDDGQCTPAMGDVPPCIGGGCKVTINCQADASGILNLSIPFKSSIDQTTSFVLTVNNYTRRATNFAIYYPPNGTLPACANLSTDRWPTSGEVGLTIHFNSPIECN